MDEIEITALFPAIPVLANIVLLAARFAVTTLLIFKFVSLVSVTAGNVTVYVEVFGTEAIVCVLLYLFPSVPDVEPDTTIFWPATKPWELWVNVAVYTAGDPALPTDTLAWERSPIPVTLKSEL